MICSICKNNDVRRLLDLGPQPISNRFLKSENEKEFTAPLVLNQCQHCALIQVNNPVPAQELLPVFDWITYSEPEGHLDEMVENILKLPGLTKDSIFLGISFKDDSTLKRFEQKGFSKTYRLALKEDLDINAKGAGVETIQTHLTVERAKKIVRDHGRAGVVIVRHILEHVFDIQEFVEALKELAGPDGYIVFEVPDCAKAFKGLDYTTIWEEHTLYFTPSTFQNCFSSLDLAAQKCDLYPYPFENSLVAVTQSRLVQDPGKHSQDQLQEQLRMGQNFAEQFPVFKARIRQALEELKAEYGPIALFGAGHLACVYVNFFDLKDLVEFFVDDNPNKLNLFMPGSRLPIYPSKVMLEKDIKVCLLSLNPLSEDKVVSRNQSFTDKGGKFFSIFPGSKYTLPGVSQGALI